MGGGSNYGTRRGASPSVFLPAPIAHGFSTHHARASPIARAQRPPPPRTHGHRGERPAPCAWATRSSSGSCASRRAPGGGGGQRCGHGAGGWGDIGPVHGVRPRVGLISPPPLRIGPIFKRASGRRDRHRIRPNPRRRSRERSSPSIARRAPRLPQYAFVIDCLERQEVGLWTSKVSRCGFRRRAG